MCLGGGIKVKQWAIMALQQGIIGKRKMTPQKVEDEYFRLIVLDSILQIKLIISKYLSP